MAFAELGAIRLAYERAGPSDRPPVILIRGLGTQLIQWPDNLLEAFHDAGYGTVVFDNRDVGLSSKCEGRIDFEALSEALARDEPVDVPYRLQDMAADVIGLMDHLDIATAHIFGISMGGMIAQLLAADYQNRVLTLTSAMSSSGNPDIPFGPARASLMSAPENPNDRDSIIAHKIATQREIGSPGYPLSDAELHAMMTAAYERCHYPAGVARQMAAVMASGSRIDALRRITCPSLVIHGRDDPLVLPEAGIDTAKHIPGAALELIDGMGHDIPPALASRIAERVVHLLNST